jgi:CheY-like chemotaxis protein/signal transduction histidine kinase
MTLDDVHENSLGNSAKGMVDTIQTCLCNIRNTNSFMLMTINRCIDYTKVSRGIKLLAKLETIDLIDTIQLPLSCMENIQNKIKIELRPMTPDICNFIITDRLWVQENLLCLLSNAVKYSSAGSVTITIRLGDEDCAVISDKFLSTVQQMAEKEETLRAAVLSVKHTRLVLDEPKGSSRSHGSALGSRPGSTNDLSLKSATRRLPSLSSIVRSLSQKSKSSVAASSAICNFSDFIVFEVEDTGIGMSDDAMKVLFAPFKQNQRLAGGTGLGLFSLAKRVEALKGKYGVRKRKDGTQGSLFWFAIPYRPDVFMAELHQPVDGNDDNRDIGIDIDATDGELAPASSGYLPSLRDVTESVGSICNKQDDGETIDTLQSIDRAPPVDDLPKSSSALRILVVDDSPSILKMTALMLRRLGHEIFQAENGEIAVQLVQQTMTDPDKRFGLILIDLQMPVMDGLEAVRRIRSLEQGCHHWIIGCSANSDTDTKEAALAAGMDSFMSKPFNVTTFMGELISLRLSAQKL